MGICQTRHRSIWRVIAGPLQRSVNGSHDGGTIGVRHRLHRWGGAEATQQVIAFGSAQIVTEFVQAVRTFFQGIVVPQGWHGSAP